MHTIRIVRVMVLFAQIADSLDTCNVGKCPSMLLYEFYCVRTVPVRPDSVLVHAERRAIRLIVLKSIDAVPPDCTVL
jgi:hypothetical protein